MCIQCSCHHFLFNNWIIKLSFSEQNTSCLCGHVDQMKQCYPKGCVSLRYTLCVSLAGSQGSSLNIVLVLHFWFYQTPQRPGGWKTWIAFYFWSSPKWPLISLFYQSTRIYCGREERERERWRGRERKLRWKKYSCITVLPLKKKSIATTISNATPMASATDVKSHSRGCVQTWLKQACQLWLRWWKSFCNPQNWAVDHREALVETSPYGDHVQVGYTLEIMTNSFIRKNHCFTLLIKLHMCTDCLAWT